LRRLALLGLLALLVWQAGAGLLTELGRLRSTTWADRAAALSLDARARYHASLGEGLAWLEALSPHLAPDDTLVVVHDGSPASIRLAAGYSALLFPRRVSSLPSPRRDALPWASVPVGIVVAHIGPRDRLTDSLVASGLVPLVQREDFQFLGRAARPESQPAGDASAAPTAPAASLPAQRLHGWRLLCMLLLPLLSGLLALRALGLRRADDPLAFWGWAWMAGCLLVALGLLAWMLLGLHLSMLRPGVLGAVTALAALLAVAWRRHGEEPRATALRAADVRPAGARWERVVFALCLALSLALMADRIVLASGHAIVGGDEASIWSAKAKALWSADGLGAPFAKLSTGVGHADYPLLDPLLQLFGFALAGRPLDFENRLLIQLCVPALLLVAAGALARCARPSIAGLLVLLLATSRGTGTSTGDACADGLVALGLLVALDAGERWRATGARRWLPLGALALAVLVASKNEGLMLALGAVAAFALTGLVREARAAATRAGRALEPGAASRAVWLLVPLVLAVTGALLNARFGFQNDLLAAVDGHSLPERIVRHAPSVMAPLLAWVADFLLRGGVETHRLFLAGVALVLLVPGLLRREAEPPWSYRAVPVALLLALAGYLAVYVGGTTELAGMHDWLRTSFPRISFHLLPALAIWIGAASTRLATPTTLPAPAAVL
jgi:hypothetical protein